MSKLHTDVAMATIEKLHPGVPQKVSLSEDVRKKCKVQRLEKEPRFHTQPRKEAIHQSSDDHFGALNAPRVSTAIDRKVVSHLKRHISKRAKERRYLMKEQMNNNRDDMGEGRRRRSATEKVEEITSKNIFTSYSETGEKYHDHRVRPPHATVNGSLLLPSSEAGPEVADGGVISLAARNVKNGRDLFTVRMSSSTDDPVKEAVPPVSSSHLPPIAPKGTMVGGADSNGCADCEEPPAAVQETRLYSQKILTAGLSKRSSTFSEVSLPALTSHKRTMEVTETNMSNGTDKSDTPDSPANTPATERLETKDCTSLTTEKMMEILDGTVHKECPPVNTVHYLYIACGNSDMEAELSFMQEHLYPHLREYFRMKGHELRILDLHWGFKDTISDDHRIPDVLQRAITKARTTDLKISFVVLLGQKYGTCVLPSQIPKEEFENILAAATSYRKQQKSCLLASLCESRDRGSVPEMEEAGTESEVELTVSDGQQSTQASSTGAEHQVTPTSSEADGDETKDGNENPTTETDNTLEENVDSLTDQQTLIMLKQIEEELPDTEGLCQWYVLDENAIPPVYKLQNISTFHKDILRNDATKRQMAKFSFGATESRLLKLLQTFGTCELVGKETLRQYTTSVLDQELHSLFGNHKAAERTVCFVRTFDHLTERLDEPTAGEYLDLKPGNERAVDHDNVMKIENIRNAILNGSGKICEQNLSTFLVEWTSGGIRPGSNRQHFLYLERLCRTLTDLIACPLELKAPCLRELATWKSELFLELSEHVRKCHKKARGFHGRKDVLSIIKSYLKSDTRLPMVVYGKSGCGKSAILAKTAKSVMKWFKSLVSRPRVLVRMIGCTTNSTNIRSMLRDVSLQLCHAFAGSLEEIPRDYMGVINDLWCRIGQADKENPVIVILDGIDRLSDEHSAKNLLWLPLELPPHVHLIISMSSEDKCTCLQFARKLLAGHDNCFLEVGQLAEEEVLTMFGHWLKHSERTVTEEQYEFLVQTFRRYPYPLFLKMAKTEAVTWTSYMPPDVVKLGETVRKAVSLRFVRLEIDHGEPLTRRALGYITASRHGLSSNEMEDILSMDNAVMDDVMATYKSPKRRLPTLLWVRLLEDMKDLVSECKGDNVRTINWAHSEISEAAHERYLSQRDKAPSYHKALSEYFLGSLSGKSKLHSGSDKGVDCFVADQKLYTEGRRISAGNGSLGVHNLQAINELPYHLMRCQMTSLLKQACLCNFEWMQARLCGTSFEVLLEDYESALTVETNDPELSLLYEALFLSSRALQREPRQLASQLVGRLYRCVSADNPVAPGDPMKYPNLHILLAAIKRSPVPSLMPSVGCLVEPGGIQFHLLSGHTKPVTSVTLISDGIQALTTSEDGTMKLWDIRVGKVVKSIDGAGSKVCAINAAKGKPLAITVEETCIKAYDLDSGSCVFTTPGYIDPASISVAAEGKILAAVFDGSNVFRSWSLEDFSQLCQTHIPEKSVHKNNSVLIADSSFAEHVLHAFRDGNFATVRHARSGKMLTNLQCHEETSAAVALAVTREYFIICCRQQSITQEEVHALELFDVLKMTYIRSIRGCASDNIRQLSTNLSGSHAISISPNTRNNSTDVAVFNLETEEHKHMATHPGISTMCACLDFRYCVTASEGDNCLKVWNLSPKINQPAPKLKKQFGISDIWPMVDNPRYVVAKAVNNGPISVWNVTKGKCLQSAVRIERGLTEGTDALVIRNTRLVILTDRGFSNISDDQRPVFQTVLIYDLKMKKYIRKLSGCYIVPALSHEYILLDNDSLLGPSDNRSHFIIWNLVSGHAASRIKTGFRELERMRLEHVVQLVEAPRSNRGTPGMMTSRDKLIPSKSARSLRDDEWTVTDKQRLEELQKEKENAVDQFLVSGDQKTLVASYYAHHLCVFDIPSRTHTCTLQTECSMMFFHSSALTFDGGHFVHANYDEDSKVSYVTLWDCSTGEVKRRLKRETNVTALAITDEAERVVIGRPNELHVWDPMKPHSLRRIRGYSGFRMQMKSKIFIVESGTRAVVFSTDISVWDLTQGSVLAVFTPDTKINVCSVVLDGRVIIAGMYDKPELVILRLTSNKVAQVEDAGGVELFGETTGDTSDEDDDDMKSDENDD